MRWILFFLGFTCLLGCKQEVKVRVANHSDIEMKDVVIKFPSETEKYGTIAPGGKTDYRVVGKVYRYAYIEAFVDNQEAVLQPKDYVGEKLLRPGKYTYALSYYADESDKYIRLKLKLVKD